MIQDTYWNFVNHFALTNHYYSRQRVEMGATDFPFYCRSPTPNQFRHKIEFPATPHCRQSVRLKRSANNAPLGSETLASSNGSRIATRLLIKLQTCLVPRDSGTCLRRSGRRSSAAVISSHFAGRRHPFKNDRQSTVYGKQLTAGLRRWPNNRIANHRQTNRWSGSPGQNKNWAKRKRRPENSGRRHQCSLNARFRQQLSRYDACGPERPCPPKLRQRAAELPAAAQLQR